MALLYLNLAVLLCTLEAAYVQTTTTSRELSTSLLYDPSFLLLFGIDIAVPLCVALLSRRAFMVLVVLQAFLSSVLLHYSLFFYNPLTLSTIYHSMQGLDALGGGVFAFVRWNIVLAVSISCATKLVLAQLSRINDCWMPRIWGMRGITAILCMMAVFWISTTIYAKTGLSLVWVDSRGHRTATERRLEDGTRETVRTLGYLATWIGEFLSGTYTDLELIYKETRCVDPAEDAFGSSSAHNWDGNPVPPLQRDIVLVQVESLDFEALTMTASSAPVLPFLHSLAEESVLLKVFAPHKVGSSNSDYELLNSRVADQNVLYYEYITEYPDSVVSCLSQRGFATAVFHGLEGSLFHLREAYAAMGFDNLNFKEDLRKHGYIQATGMLDHIPDRQVFTAALDYSARGEQQAIFIITMDSHIPFSNVRREFATQRGSFARYISALRNFDDAFKEFYGQLPEGTLLLLWGDHGSDVTYPGEYPPNKRHVPFILHIKGNTGWIRGPGKGARDQQERRVYTLCELSYYLKRIFSQPVTGK